VGNHVIILSLSKQDDNFDHESHLFPVKDNGVTLTAFTTRPYTSKENKKLLSGILPGFCQILLLTTLLCLHFSTKEQA